MVDSIGEKASLGLVAAPAIEKRSLVVRGRQVILDEDLADLYGVETRRLIEQVKRNWASTTHSSTRSSKTLRQLVAPERPKKPVGFMPPEDDAG